MNPMMLSRAQSLTRSISAHGDRIGRLADKRTVTVQALREQGASWADLARSLDMTPQAEVKIAKRKVAG